MERMRANPRDDWTIEQMQTVADAQGVEWRNPRGSHVVFVTSSGDPLSVPARRPVKAVYVREFVELIDGA